MMQLVTKYYHSELSGPRKGTWVWGETLTGTSLAGTARRPHEIRAALSLAFERGLPPAGGQRSHDGGFVRFLGLCHKQNSKSCISFIIDF